MELVAALPSWRALWVALIVMSTIGLLEGARSIATIIDTGSTNRKGMRLEIELNGHARVLTSAGSADSPQIKLPQKLCANLMRLVVTARPLDKLPTRHCIKSVSFGSQLFVEFEGERSPDLSCPGQTDERAAALQKAVNDILQAAQPYRTRELIR